MSSSQGPQIQKTLATDPWAAVLHQKSEIAPLQDEGNVRSYETTLQSLNGALLCDAVAKNDVQLVKDLLQGGYSIDEQDNDGNTPLHIAAELGFPALIKMLVAAGASTEIHGGDLDATPLHIAIACGQTAAALTLLDLGADVNAVGAYGTTALEIAARNNEIKVMLALIRRGAKIDARSESGWTPLHVAAGFNNPMAIAVLVRFGADPNSRDVDGDTPLMTSCSMEHLGCVQQLLSGGANPRILAAVRIIQNATH